MWTTPSNDNFTEVLNALPIDLPRISEHEGQLLTCEVTHEEVYLTVLALPIGKSPSPYGFNVKFFPFFGLVIGDQLLAVVQYFFNNSNMPSSLGRTFIALIPKKENPRSVSNYRPISLCNVCFKIASKILANLLKAVLPNIIGREQVSFVSWRCSFDNIIVV